MGSHQLLQERQVYAMALTPPTAIWPAVAPVGVRGDQSHWRTSEATYRVPCAVDTNRCSLASAGVKNYCWAPEGFVTDFVWDFKLIRWYYPLWRLDVCYWHWHSSRGENSGKYPINEVAPEEIGNVYNAWYSDAARKEK
jgi:hypothetical protein